MRANTVSDFWAKVDRTGGADACWLWTGSKTASGYGSFSMRGQYHSVHRLAWEATHGVIAPGLFACHHCDTPLCCNPAHLFLGTTQENTADRDRKGRARGVQGSANFWAKLTDEQVAEIRRRYAEGGGGRHGGVSYTQLGREFGLHPQNIGRIIRGEGYRGRALTDNAKTPDSSTFAAVTNGPVLAPGPPPTTGDSGDAGG